MYLIGNWKMNGSCAVLESFLKTINLPPSNISPVICPPFPYLAQAKKGLPRGYDLGAQDCSIHPQGSFTGQVSASMLKDVGANYVIVGHAERRSWESDEDVKQKATHCLEAGITPIICIAAPSEALSRAPSLGNFFIAYEPLGAIGTKTPDKEAISQLFLLRETIQDRPLLYGGGIHAETIADFIPHVDGFLVGRASLESQSWNALVDALSL